MKRYLRDGSSTLGMRPPPGGYAGDPTEQQDQNSQVDPAGTTALIPMHRNHTRVITVVCVAVVVAAAAALVGVGTMKSTHAAAHRPVVGGALNPVDVSVSPSAGAQKQTVTCVPSLAACLPTAPAGSSSWSTTWGSLPMIVTADQFVTSFWSSNDGFNAAREARLSEDGLISIAKITWDAPDGSEVDDILFNFTTAVGASSWEHFLSWLEDTDVSQFPIPGAQDAHGSVRATNSHGIAWSLATGVSGTTVMQYWYSVNKKPDTQATAQAAAAQMQQIAGTAVTRAVPAQAATQVPSAAAHANTLSCSAIASCLVAAPPGAIAPTSGYRAQTEVTAAQFATQHLAAGSNTEQATLLAGAGAQQITHVAWIGPDFSYVDMSILPFGSNDLAEASVAAQEGADLPGHRDFAVPGIPDAHGFIGAMDDRGDIPVEIIGTVGAQEVRLDFASPATADIVEAVTLFDQQYTALS